LLVRKKPFYNDSMSSINSIDLMIFQLLVRKKPFYNFTLTPVVPVGGGFNRSVAITPSSTCDN